MEEIDEERGKEVEIVTEVTQLSCGLPDGYEQSQGKRYRMEIKMDMKFWSGWMIFGIGKYKSKWIGRTGADVITDVATSRIPMTMAAMIQIDGEDIFRNETYELEGQCFGWVIHMHVDFWPRIITIIRVERKTIMRWELSFSVNEND